MKAIFFLFAVLFTFAACKDSDELSKFTTIDSAEDYLIFGAVYGACIGDCRNLYLLTRGQLQEDANENAPGDVYGETIFQANSLDDSKFQLASQLLNVPNVLLENAFSDTDQLDRLADHDYYMMGKIDDKTFTLIYDEINEEADQALIDYADLTLSVFVEIQ